MNGSILHVNQWHHPWSPQSKHRTQDKPPTNVTRARSMAYSWHPQTQGKICLTYDSNKRGYFSKWYVPKSL